jgi:hypothetical protein
VEDQAAAALRGDVFGPIGVQKGGRRNMEKKEHGFSSPFSGERFLRVLYKAYRTGFPPPFSYIYAFGRKIRKIDIAHVHQQHRDSFEYGMKDFGV